MRDQKSVCLQLSLECCSHSAFKLLVPHGLVFHSGHYGGLQHRVESSRALGEITCFVVSFLSIFIELNPVFNMALRAAAHKLLPQLLSSQSLASLSLVSSSTGTCVLATKASKQESSPAPAAAPGTTIYRQDAPGLPPGTPKATVDAIPTTVRGQVREKAGRTTRCSTEKIHAQRKKETPASCSWGHYNAGL